MNVFDSVVCIVVGAMNS